MGSRIGGSGSRSILAGSSAVALAALVVGVALVVLFLKDDAPLRLDRWIDAGLGLGSPDVPEEWHRVLGLPGTMTGALAAALAIGGVFVVVWRTWWPLVLILVALLGATMTAFALKQVVGRVSPRFWLDPEHPIGVSFPSAHVARVSAVVGVAVVVVAILYGRRLAVAASILAATAVFATAMAQFYLRLHWFTDVIGGLAIGVFWAAVLVPIATARVRRPDPLDAPRDLGSRT